MTDKVVAYITNGDRLLVFSHPHHPDAGIQVPAGTVEEGESHEEAVLREAVEETGLEDLALRSFLGSREYDPSQFGLDGAQRWHFFHLESLGDPPERWRHHERHPSDGTPGPIEFELYWVRLPGEVPVLIPGQGDLLNEIKLFEGG